MILLCGLDSCSSQGLCFSGILLLSAKDEHRHDFKCDVDLKALLRLYTVIRDVCLLQSYVCQSRDVVSVTHGGFVGRTAPDVVGTFLHSFFKTPLIII